MSDELSMKKQKYCKGFTLVELLIAISLIAILSGVLLSVINPRGIQRKARDSQRVADLAKVKVALESYFTDHRAYPVSGSWVLVHNVSGLVTDYINVLPRDPKEDLACATTNWRSYYYKTDSTGSRYVLATNVEVSSPAGCGSLPTTVQAICSTAPCGGGSNVHYTTAE